MSMGPHMHRNAGESWFTMYSEMQNLNLKILHEQNDVQLRHFRKKVIYSFNLNILLQRLPLCRREIWQKLPTILDMCLHKGGTSMHSIKENNLKVVIGYLRIMTVVTPTLHQLVTHSTCYIREPLRATQLTT